MENATKALLIGAAILLSVMILSLIVMSYNEISSYYKAKSDTIDIEQTTEVNQAFENYNQNKIRGSDMISLMNRVIDYNERQSYLVGTNFKRIEVTIFIGDNDILNQFKYNTSDNSILTAKITNVGNGTDNKNLDKQLIKITNTTTELINSASKKGINNLTEEKLQKLVANISNIFVDEASKNQETFDGVQAISNRKRRAELIKNILGISISLDNNAMANTSESKNQIDAIKDMTATYYQYTQFKRAQFECTGTEYDENTGRIKKMEFKIKTTNDGKVMFN